MANRTLVQFTVGQRRIQVTESDVSDLRAVALAVLCTPVFPVALLWGWWLRRLPLRTSGVHIAVFQLGGIGDHIFCMPLLHALKQRHPDGTITLITHTDGAMFQSIDRLVDNVITTRLGRMVRRSSAGGGRYGGLFAVFAGDSWIVFQLLWRRIDVSVAIGPTQIVADEAAALFFLAGTKDRRGSFYVPPRARRWLSISAAQMADDSGVNARLLYLQAAESGRMPDQLDAAWKVHLVTDTDTVRRYLAAPPRLTVVIHPGAGAALNLKAWPVDHYAAVAERLVREYDAQVLLTGSSAETGLCEEVRRRIHAHNLAGHLTIPQLAGLFAQADLVLTNDTGTLHLADAAGARKMVGIFGPTNPRLAAPLSDDCIIVQRALECAPCMLLDASDVSRKCHNPKQYTCLLDLSVDEVWAAVERALSQWPPRQPSVVASYGSAQP